MFWVGEKRNESMIFAVFQPYQPTPTPLYQLHLDGSVCAACYYSADSAFECAWCKLSKTFKNLPYFPPPAIHHHNNYLSTMFSRVFAMIWTMFDFLPLSLYICNRLQLWFSDSRLALKCKFQYDYMQKKTRAFFVCYCFFSFCLKKYKFLQWTFHWRYGETCYNLKAGIGMLMFL